MTTGVYFFWEMRSSIPRSAPNSGSITTDRRGRSITRAIPGGTGSASPIRGSTVSANFAGCAVARTTPRAPGRRRNSSRSPSSPTAVCGSIATPRRRQLGPRVQVVEGLGEEAADVDRVGGGERQAGVEVRVGEGLADESLAVVEAAANGDGGDVSAQGGELGLLAGAHLAERRSARPRPRRRGWGRGRARAGGCRARFRAGGRGNRGRRG